MKAANILPALAVGLVIGAFSGYNFSPQKKPETPKAEAAISVCDNSALEKSFNNISPEEIRAYLNAQTMDEKLKKSDEILGKILQAMVAHLGFKLSTEDLGKFGQASQLAACPEVVLPPTKSVTFTDVKGTAPAATTTLPEAGNFPVAAYLAEVKKAVTDEEIKKVVDQLPPNPLERIQNSKTLSQPQVQFLSGSFEGQIVFLKDRKVHRTTIDFEYTPGSQGNLKGKAKIVVYNEQGKAYSTGTTNGDLSGRFNGTPYSVFIENGGDYFELIYFPERDMLSGNLYEIKNLKSTKTGNVTYRRL